MQWIFGALFGGYAAANVLKWHWWRFNAYGYFWGMMSGLMASLALPLFFPSLQPLYAFPYLLLAGLVGSVIGTLLTAPEDDVVLMSFYEKVRPWGFWQPIKEKVIAQNPEFKPCNTLPRDAFNIVVGMTWQISLVVLPIYLVIKEFESMLMAFTVTLLTSWILKKNWYDKLEN